MEIGKILIVDDNENLLETLGDILNEKGYRIATAKTGREGIRKARNGYFNVSLIDINLPDSSGMKVLETFRELYPSRMNIIITGNATLDNAVEALNLGANAYIMKPIDHDKLLNMIDECVEKQREVKMISERKLEKSFEDKTIDEDAEMGRTRLMQKYYE